MYIILLFSFILLNLSYAVNTKHLAKNKQESHLCRIIKQRKFEYSVQCARSKTLCKPLYIPESKNCR